MTPSSYRGWLRIERLDVADPSNLDRYLATLPENRRAIARETISRELYRLPIACHAHAQENAMTENHDTQPEAPAPTIADFQELGTPEQLAELYGALALARGEFTKIAKNRTVTIKGKTEYSFDYADMEESLAATVPALAKHGLVVIQPPTINVIRTILAHKSGARVVTIMALPGAEDIKTFGASITYLRRYCYNALLCLSADADADDTPIAARGEAHAESGPRSQPSVPKRDETPAAPRPTQRTDSASPAAASGSPSTTPPSSNASPVATSSDGPLTAEQQQSIRKLCEGAGATGADAKALINELLSPHNETKLSQANYKRIVTELGRLAINAKEQANV